MLPRRLKARIAESHALKLRIKAGVDIKAPANPFELATSLGIDVRFIDLPSVEGVYLPQSPPQIVISSLRPAGRQAFTCAHELGHHDLEHGEKLDELIESRRSDRINDPDEYQADTFASFLLMPRSAVLHAFVSRGWRIEHAMAEQYYQASLWLGVGYTTLIGHISRQLKLLDWPRGDELMGKSLRSIRASILGRQCNGNVYAIDEHWKNRTVNCEIGDALLIPRGASIEGIALAESEKVKSGVVALATENGVATVVAGNSVTTTVRVARKGYVGRYIYKYLEETPVGD